MPQDRPARGSVAEFRLRLGRLPAGHPSSPWDDQGVPRPAPQQLRQLELPLADEERDAESPARASLLAASADLSGPAITPGYGDEGSSRTELPPTPEPPAIEPPPRRATAERDTAERAHRQRPTAGRAIAEPQRRGRAGLPVRIGVADRPQRDYPRPRRPPAGRHGAGEYGNGAAGDHAGNGTGAAGNGGLTPAAAPRRDGTNPYSTGTSHDAVPPADERTARNGRTSSPSSVFDADWRNLDAAPGQNGHAESEPGRSAAGQAADRVTGEHATTNGAPSANGTPAGFRPPAHPRAGEDRRGGAGEVPRRRRPQHVRRLRRERPDPGHAPRRVLPAARPAGARQRGELAQVTRALQGEAGPDDRAEPRHPGPGTRGRDLRRGPVHVPVRAAGLHRRHLAGAPPAQGPGLRAGGPAQPVGEPRGQGHQDALA